MGGLIELLRYIDSNNTAVLCTRKQTAQGTDIVEGIFTEICPELHAPVQRNWQNLTKFRHPF